MTEQQTGQGRLLDAITQVKALTESENPAWLQMPAARRMMFDILTQLSLANTEIAAEMAELIDARPSHCCACGLEHGPAYIYSGICDSCYEDRIA